MILSFVPSPVTIPDNKFSWQLEDFENNNSEVVSDNNTDNC